MGLLSSLLKSEARKLASNVVSDMISSTITDTAPVKRPDVRETKEAGGEKGLRERLETVIGQEWSDYELRKKVPAAEIGAQWGARAYSYGLYRNGQPKAMIMILTDRNHYRKKDVVLAREACEEKGIPYMNFMSHLPNRTEYISKRLRENII